MKAFIPTGKGWLSVDQVSAVSEDGASFTFEGSRVQIEGSAHDTILEIVPVAGAWEVVFPDLDNKGSVWTVPVIAWGWTLGGSIVPITPFHRDGIFQTEPALRMKGSQEVYTRDTIFLNQADFLEQ